MKLYCLSSDAAKPCFVVSMNGVVVMLDCGLSAQSVLSFLPLPPVPSARLAALPAYTPPHLNDPQLEGELKECCGRVFVDSVPEFCPPLDKVVSFASLDAILISNYTCMLALPFVTEGTGFRGAVYCTEPTLSIGRLYLEELCEWLARAGAGARARRWKELVHLLPAPLAHAVRPRAWRRLYGRKAVDAALARVRVVAYDEPAGVVGALTATPLASGYCLGSANWLLQAPSARLAYVAGSSTLTTHPRPIAQQALKNADALLLAQLTQTPQHNPDNMLGDLCVHAALTLRAGGCVLLPSYGSGVLFDLLECLGAHLEAAGLAHVPMYVLQPRAPQTLAYGNILAEWLCGAKRARVLLPEEPFVHAALARAGRLKAAPDAVLADFRQPCVVFAGHPSLRFGAAVHLLDAWGSSASHAVIFTEPDFPHAEALAPFQPLALKVFHCPIDTALNYAQASKLVRELKPKMLALPEHYAPPAHNNAGACGAARGISVDIPTVVLRRGGSVPLRGAGGGRAVVGGALAPELLPRLRTALATRGAAALRMELRRRDARLELRPVRRLPPLPKAEAGAEAEAEEGSSSSDEDWGWWGGCAGPALRAAASRAGLGAGRLEQGADGSVLHVARHDALLHLDPKVTHVFCEPKRAARRRLRRALREAAPPRPAAPAASTSTNTSTAAE